MLVVPSFLSTFLGANIEITYQVFLTNEKKRAARTISLLLIVFSPLKHWTLSLKTVSLQFEEALIATCKLIYGDEGPRGENSLTCSHSSACILEDC